MVASAQEKNEPLRANLSNYKLRLLEYPFLVSVGSIALAGFVSTNYQAVNELNHVYKCRFESQTHVAAQSSGPKAFTNSGTMLSPDQWLLFSLSRVASGGCGTTL